MLVCFQQALEQLDFLIADRAFVRCGDYQGIQFVKRLKLLDRNKQRAEVAIYFRRFDEAESLYLHMDCKDQALELRIRLGDWFKVLELLSQSDSAMAAGSNGNNSNPNNNNGRDDAITTCYHKLGEYFSDRNHWYFVFCVLYYIILRE